MKAWGVPLVSGTEGGVAPGGVVGPPGPTGGGSPAPLTGVGGGT
jgi:hypothetical protein